MNDNITERAQELARAGQAAFERGDALAQNPHSGEDAMWWAIGWRQTQQAAKASVITHVDVGLSQQMARATGKKTSTDILCRAEDGDSIRDSLTAIQSVRGGPPAACNCAKCKRIVELLEGGTSLARARRIVLG